MNWGEAKDMVLESYNLFQMFHPQLPGMDTLLEVAA